MRINNNLMAMNTHRQLGLANAGGAKSMEKLSSGLRINRAGDDAAGLAISEKMRGQIRGLTQASRNAQDGISLIQTAEGALNETHAILQRMRELAVQSSTDTNTDADRANIQDEMNQLATEITRISEQTEFNTMKLLDGKFENKKFHIGANEAQDVTLKINKMDSEALKVAGTGGASFEIAGTTVDSTNTNSTLHSTNATYNVMKYEDYVGTDGNAIALADSASAALTDIKYVLVDKDGNAVATSEDALTFTELATVADDRGALTFANTVNSGEVKVDGAGVATATATIEDNKLAGGTYKIVDVSNNPQYNGWNVGLADSNGNLVALGATDAAGTAGAAGGTDVTHWVSTKDHTEVLMEQVANSDFAVGTEITVSGDGIDVSTQKSASKAITTINNALETVSKERSKLGAMQNRLEHTIKNLDTSSENLQASEARIRDVDMAKEMMEQTKQNILQQASTAMLAQANQQPQGVLQLLR